MENPIPVSTSEHVSLDQIMKDYAREYVPETKTWTSSLLKETTYDALKYEFTVTFNNDKKYKYSKFMPEKYIAFCQAESQGKFFLAEVRDTYKDGDNVAKLPDNE
jgi:hypothetical protein